MQDLLTLGERIKSAAFGTGELHFEDFGGLLKRLDHVRRVRNHELGRISGRLWNRSVTPLAGASEAKFCNGGPGGETSNGEVCPGFLDAGGQCL